MEELKKLNEKLAKLLADPQPGFSTWRLALRETLLQMADYAGCGLISEMVNQPDFKPYVKA